MRLSASKGIREYQSTYRLPEDVKAMLTNLSVKEDRSENKIIVAAIREKYERDIEGKQ